MSYRWSCFGDIDRTPNVVLVVQWMNRLSIVCFCELDFDTQFSFVASIVEPIVKQADDVVLVMVLSKVVPYW
jgi:hypothetical protein